MHLLLLTNGRLRKLPLAPELALAAALKVRWLAVSYHRHLQQHLWGRADRECRALTPPPVDGPVDGPVDAVTRRAHFPIASRVRRCMATHGAYMKAVRTVLANGTWTCLR